MDLIDNLIDKIINQNRFKRRFILCSVDLILLPISFLISNIIVFDKLIGRLEIHDAIFITFTLNIIGFIVYIFLGKYDGITKYANSIDLYSLAFKNVLITFSLILILYLLRFDLYNLKFWIIFWIMQTLIIGGTNFVFRDILQKLNSGKYSNKSNIAIYGASSKGAQMAANIKFDSNYKLIAFFDDSPNLWGRNIGGIKIYNPKRIIEFRDKIKTILLSDSNSLNNDNKFIFFNKSIECGIDILKVPPYEQLTEFKKNFSSYKPLKIEDLLSRNSVRADIKLINKTINNSVICVTGAGGSIGSELCREILRHNPKALILLEMNEQNLYKIQNEFNYINKSNTDIKINFVLGNATNKVLIRNILNKFNVQILFHAAAYKHVPIVENNPLAGIFNNVISTFVVCDEAKKANLKKVILVSTDKAVRPTNVMGASKRLAELVVKAFSEKTKQISNKSTHYSMVRFGNVLGSSGSVVPLFEKQISEGGPVTITHKEIIRYFMTIKEAAQLVIQASTLTKGGEVFILDMGGPIKIYDLAEKMIKLKGFSIKSAKNPNGDIEIISTGLRPGEKLYEELLINGEAESTSHPLIYKAKESYKEDTSLLKEIKELDIHLQEEREDMVFKILKKFVPEWNNF